MEEMKRHLKVKDQSVDTSGITKDYQIALCEYIWNGFEANATVVSVNYEINIAEGISSISVQDNGDGICFETLDDVFGYFMASQKNMLSTQIKSKANKGKGRFAFNAFASDAVWETVYCRDGKHYKYEIAISSGEKDVYTPTPPMPVEDSDTGCTVTFTGIMRMLPEDLNFKVLEENFLVEFAWYLYLYKENNVRLVVNGTDLDYTRWIDEDLTIELETNIEDEHFSIKIIVWKEKIKEKFCTYYINSKDELKSRSTTTFNRNTVNFNHSAYVKSSFFDKRNSAAITLEDIKREERIYQKLNKFMQNLIEERLHSFLLRNSENEIEKMRKRGSFPHFSDNPWDKVREQNFTNVVKELYCIESKIFYKLKPIQEKSLLAFLNLLLDSAERENILSIIEEIVSLSSQQREDFAKILQKTKLENILNSIKLIESRYTVIEGLRTIVYDLANYANEREHIQKIVESHYWIFGERYNLVSADERMQKALEKYLYLIDGKDAPSPKLESDGDINRRMDIFMCRKQLAEDSYETQLEENIIVELKAPMVKLTNKVYRQIEDYMLFITKHHEFNTQLRRWKFISVCREIDDDIRNKYDAFRDKGKKFLIYQASNFEIYAMTWADVFKDFEIRHSFILDRLKYDCEKLSREMLPKETEQSRATADAITNKMLATV